MTPAAMAINDISTAATFTIATFIITAAPFAIGFLETALAIEDSSNGIWR